MLDKLTLKIKLLFAFIVTASFAVIVGVVANFFSNEVIHAYNDVATQNVPNLVHFIEMNAARYRMIIPLAQIAGDQPTPEELKDVSAQFETALTDFNAAAANYESLPFSDGETELWRQFKDGSLKHLVDMSREMIRLSGTGSPEDQARRDALWNGEFAQLRAQSSTDFGKIIEFQSTETSERIKYATYENDLMEVSVLSTIIVGFVLSLGLGFFIATTLSKSVKQVSTQLMEGADQVSLASTELSNASQQLAAGASSSAASLEEGVASIEELSSMVKMNANNAQQAANLSKQGAEAAESSREEIEELVKRMSDIQHSSKKIEDIIALIDDIAFQTNLLALNASVEAARAGDQGRGFAVVADAVRTLAQKSSASAKDIADLIKQSVQQVDEGVDIAKKSSSSLDALTTAIKKISDINQEISMASTEQSHGVSQLSMAMNTLDKTVQGNAASSEEVAASSVELSAQSTSLKAGVQKLLAIVDGASNSSPPPAAGGEKKAPLKLIKNPQAPITNAKVSSKEVLPFDEDAGPRKVGTTDGF